MWFYILLKLSCKQYKTDYQNIKMFFVSFITTNKKPIVDIQKRRKESKHIMPKIIKSKERQQERKKGTKEQQMNF